MGALRVDSVFWMDLDYWDRTLQNYDAEVVSVYDLDADGMVSKLIHELARTNSTASAADLGCGIGKFTELLSGLYRRVEACDFSEQGLQRTRERCRGKPHINYHQLDLTSDPVPFDPVDLVLCVNVLMMPLMDERLRAWRTVTNQVRRQGHLLLVVPAIESILMERHCEIENQLNEGNSCQASLQETLPEDSTAMDFHQGVYRIENVRTKHYLKAELEATLEDQQFTVRQIHKLRYRRDCDSDTLDTWDWLVLAQRN
ncbi:class I SAM-dependent methyltransferase [Coraliomargarita parva]|uniref:class I SAM-dependent methyltransferase n=1 Tax=Coraliomargarita parva TaxID=3014050 RepID=UPI0022B416D6|nr:class I SAM-dependent methyltransferase [Coraliomargarita parva]